MKGNLMNIEIKIKTATYNQKRLSALKYTKKPCHLYKKYMCEMLYITDKIDRKVATHETHKYYLYVPENPNDEMKLVIKSQCLDHKNNIETIYEFLINVFCFLLEAKIKDKIKELDPILFRVKDLIMRQTDRKTM